MLLIGSRALSLVAPVLLTRESKDYDFICTRAEYEEWMAKNSSKINPTEIYPEKNGTKMVVKGSSILEFEFATPGSSCELLQQIVDEDPSTLDTPFGKVPNLDLLFTIKASHRYLKDSPHFWKTALDYHRMKAVGAKVRPEYVKFLKLRESETYEYKHPNLNRSKEQFFADDSINYVWDHDTIHESVARGERPAYTYYMKDGAQVQCDKNKFFALPKEVQMNGVIEEAAVLAIERSLVPHQGVWTPEYAWRFALMKVCSSITSGWFREFGYENIFQILKQFPQGYWEKFQADVQAGRVKPFSGKTY